MVLAFRITITQTVLAMLFATILFAKDAFSQSILEKKFTLFVKNVSIEKLIMDVQKEANVKFSYSSNVLIAGKTFDYQAVNKTIQSFLDEMILPNGINYREVNNQIVLFTQTKSSSSLPFAASVRSNQERVIEGVIYNEQGQPEQGVSVKIKGSAAGTMTDADGRYSIEGPDGNFTLVVSAVGYVTTEIVVTNQTRLNITLKAADKVLDDVVVVGYGTQRKADVTGSVVRISTEKTSDLPNYNILQSLQGRAPGLNVTSPDRPGENPQITIRGVNSISASTNPLIVLDGVIYNGNLSEINANDIASVDVLKDASAAAVYGSRAANGVLLITSKTGKTGSPQFNFNTYFGRQVADNLVKVLDGPGYLQKVLDFREATGLVADPSKIDTYITVTEAQNKNNGVTTDWMDKVIRQSNMTNYHLDVSGKSSNTNYYVSGTHFRQNGIVLNDNYNRTTLNLNLTNKLKDWLSVSFKTMFSAQDFSGREASLTSAYQQSPYGSFLDPNGPGGYALLPVGDPLGVNPLANTLINNKDKRNSLWGLFSSNVDVPFIPGLRWTMNYSANLRNAQTNEFIDKLSSTAGTTANGIATKNFAQSYDWTFDNYLNYKRKFGLHNLDATFLISRERNQVETNEMIGRNFFTEANGYNNMSIAGVQQVASNFEEQNSIAMMGRINYGFDNRYALTLTTRRDGYSGFAERNKFGIFPSVAVAWTATNEKFMKDISWLDYLKLRLSYGENGNQAVGRYQSLARMTTSNYVFGQTSVATVFVNSMANSNLSWETTTSKNIGIDFTMLNWRINGSVDVYASRTRDILLKKALPQTSGFSEIFTNIGEVANKGVELSLTSVNIKNDTRQFQWESGFVFALNRNKILKLTGADVNNDGIEDDDIRNQWFIGEPLGSIFGYNINGIHQLNEPGIPVGFRPGDFRIVDKNKDGVLNASDRMILGNNLPSYTFSISNTVRFKQLNLYVLINSIQGGNGYYMGNNYATRSPNAPFTTFSERFNVQDVPYWTPKRASNEYPRINYNPAFPHPVLEDRSFIRLQDVSLSYSFERSMLDKLKLSNLRIYLSGKNMFTITKWTGYDPENGSTLVNFPLMRTFTMGLDLKF